jgi:predicted DNA-binding antitoxin AbrB/MazE fold protein
MIATHLFKGRAVTMTIEATYENGVLRPAEPLPLKESQKVRVTLHTQPPDILQAYGIMEWKGDAETAERFALDPALDPQEGS